MEVVGISQEMRQGGLRCRGNASMILNALSSLKDEDDVDLTDFFIQYRRLKDSNQKVKTFSLLGLRENSHPTIAKVSLKQYKKWDEYRLDVVPCFHGNEEEPLKFHPVFTRAILEAKTSFFLKKRKRVDIDINRLCQLFRKCGFKREAICHPEHIVSYLERQEASCLPIEYPLEILGYGLKVVLDGVGTYIYPDPDREHLSFKVASKGGVISACCHRDTDPKVVIKIVNLRRGPISGEDEVFETECLHQKIGQEARLMFA